MAASAEQDRRLEGWKEIGAAFMRPVHADTARRRADEHALPVHRPALGNSWIMLSELRAWERAKELAA